MEILKETGRAKLLKKDGVEFWVQNRWLRADNTLTAAGVKSFEKAKELFEKNGGKNKNELIQEWNNKLIDLSNRVVRETAKAIMVEDECEAYDAMNECYLIRQLNVWVPKAALEADMKLSQRAYANFYNNAASYKFSEYRGYGETSAF